jgi:hypothetical protein
MLQKNSSTATSAHPPQRLPLCRNVRSRCGRIHLNRNAALFAAKLTYSPQCRHIRRKLSLFIAMSYYLPRRNPLHRKEGLSAVTPTDTPQGLLLCRDRSLSTAM